MQHYVRPFSRGEIISLCLLILLTMSCSLVPKKDVAWTPEAIPKEVSTPGTGQLSTPVTGHMSFILSNDVSFELGRYTINDLSTNGKERLQTIVQQIKAIKDEHPGNLEGKLMSIRLKVTAYTDAVGFRKASDLIKTLSAGMKDMPSEPTARRQLLNRELSKRRTYAIGDYIVRALYDLQSDQFEVDITPEYSGLGETPPPNVNPPLSVNDPRRRITVIESYYKFEPILEYSESDQ